MTPIDWEGIEEWARNAYEVGPGVSYGIDEEVILAMCAERRELEQEIERLRVEEENLRRALGNYAPVEVAPPEEPA